MFFSRFLSEAQKTGAVSYVPNHLRNSGCDRSWYLDRNGKHVGVYVVSALPMDRHGYFCTSTVGMSNRRLARQARTVILEINENLPRTFGDSFIHISETDHVYYGKGEVKYLGQAAPDDVDMKIGGHIAQLVEDGSTIQLGIGGIPNAAAKALSGKKDLGVHTEMLSDSFLALYEQGVITNRKKTSFEDRMVTTFSFGSKALYDFIDDNPGILHLDVSKVNSPYEIATTDRMVSVNTTLQVDLTGQCASEARGMLQISGTGGQTDTAMGAKMSQGGKSIIALRSTADIKKGQGASQRISKIVSTHDRGTVISLLRADADFIVTEYGIAELRGRSLKERAEALIAVAHPDFRDGLREDAEKLYLV
jgi:acyl-CoA hydrolase